MPTGTEHDVAPPPDPATPAVADHTIPTIPLLPDVPEERPRGLGLTARVTLGTAALLAATIGLALAVATWRADTLTRRKIRDDLRSAPAVYASYDAAEAAGRVSQVRSLADQPGTKALLAELAANPETFHDSARDFAANLGASAVLLFDARGLLISRSDRDPGEEAGRDFSGVSWVAEPLSEHREVSAYILEVTRNRRLLLVASAPVTQGEGRERRLNGVLAGTFAVDDSRAARLGELLSGESAFIANVAPRDATPQVEVLAATPRLKAAAFHEVLAGLGGLDSLFGRGDGFGPFEFSAAGDAYIGTALPIKTGRGEPIAAFVVARSKDAELALFRQLRQALLLVGALTLLAALPVSYVLARRVSRPIEQLAEGAEAIRGGRLDIALPSEQAGEVGVLARAFGAMVLELKQKAALESLVAEMQRRPGDITLAPAMRTSAGTAALTGAPSSASGGPEVGRLYAARYVVLSVLGRGGMGTVFRVRDRELEEEVALKVLDPAVFGEGTRAGDLLKQEIRLARSITHPNVVRAHDLGDAEGVRFLTMEYVPGTTLRELLDRHGRLDLGPGLQIAKQMCRGLSAVHKAGVIHGDLKPRNVMVMANGVLKLMDFGVARGIGAGPAVAAASPHYMSPEQARGGELDVRTDLYSAGVVLYEIFTGRRPFDADRPQDLASMHMFESAAAPRTLRPDLPALLEQVILTCLAKSRLQRPATAADLERALMRVHV